jgi:hypothetical protein
VLELHDQNHVASSFRSLWTGHALVPAPGGKKRKRVLNARVEFSMRKHFFTTIKMDAAIEKKYEK